MLLPCVFLHEEDSFLPSRLCGFLHQELVPENEGLHCPAKDTSLETVTSLQTQGPQGFPPQLSHETRFQKREDTVLK